MPRTIINFNNINHLKIKNMIQLTKINYTIKDNTFIVFLTNNAAGIGERELLFTQSKDKIKKYIKAGYFIFGSPQIYIDGHFYLLTKSLKNRTKHHKKIVVLNAMYHIDLHINGENKIHID
jgi:hypothetical protein